MLGRSGDPMPGWVSNTGSIDDSEWRPVNLSRSLLDIGHEIEGM